MLRWFPSDDRQSKYERFWFFDGNIFHSNHENTHARTPRRSDPQEIIWEGQTGGGFTRRAHAPSKGRINQYTQDYRFEF